MTDILFFGFVIPKEVIVLSLIPIACAILVLVAGIVQYVLIFMTPEPRVKKLVQELLHPKPLKLTDEDGKETNISGPPFKL